VAAEGLIGRGRLGIGPYDGQEKAAAKPRRLVECGELPYRASMMALKVALGRISFSAIALSGR
jgi:hypothetical protein